MNNSEFALKPRSAVGAALILLVLGGFAVAADLAEIERSLAKEPRYESDQPGYVLLAFGSKATTRVWLVVDDDVVYLDRNGNNDLTDLDEKIRVAEVRQLTSANASFAEYRIYGLGDIVDPSGSPTYKKLTVRQFRRPSEKFDVSTPEDKEVKALLTQHPNLSGNISVSVDGKLHQNAGPLFGRTPAEAPIVHFGGPLTMRVDDELLGDPMVRRVGKESDLSLQIRLGTPGFGKDSFAYCDYDIVPENIHPTVVARFTSADVAKSPIVQTFFLKGRC